MPIVTTAEERIRYNEFVKNSPFGRCQQDMAWGHVKNNWDTDAVYLEENGEIIAGLTIFSVNAVQNKRLLYACRGPVCDFYDVDLVDRLIKEAKPIIDKYDSFLLRIDPEVKYDAELVEKYRQRGYILRSRESETRSFIQPRYNMLIFFDGMNEEETLASFNSKTRYNIRLSSRKGIETRYLNIAQDGQEAIDQGIDRFFELTKIMAERQGISHRPKSYFQRLFESYPESRIYESSYNGEVLSSALAIIYNKKLFYMYGASSNNERNRMPNFQMQWEMIKWALEEGMDEYDFGGVFELSNEDGLYRFKSGFCEKDGVTEWIGELDIVVDENAYDAYIEQQMKHVHR